MQLVLFLIVGFFMAPAMAQDEPTTTGCDILQMLQENANVNRSINPTSDIDQAYQTPCREPHATGAAVYYPNGQLATKSFNSEDTKIYYPNSSVMLEFDADGEEVWYYPNGEMILPSADPLAEILGFSERKTAKIEPLFKKQHAACAAGCSFVSWGIWGDKAHQKRKSCHNSGEAIDIHAIKCGAKTSGPTTAKFKSYVGCMKKKFTVLFQVKDHFEHAHIQIPKCRKIQLK